MKPTNTTEIKSAEEILAKHEDANEYHFHELDRAFIIHAMKEYAAQFVRLTLEIASKKAVADVSQNSTTNYCVVKPKSILNLESEILKLIK